MVVNCLFLLLILLVLLVTLFLFVLLVTLLLLLALVLLILLVLLIVLATLLALFILLILLATLGIIIALHRIVKLLFHILLLVENSCALQVWLQLEPPGTRAVQRRQAFVNVVESIGKHLASRLFRLHDVVFEHAAAVL